MNDQPITSASTPPPPLPGRPEPADLDPKFRAGVPKLRRPEPLPGSRSPIRKQESAVPVYMHRRPHKTFPPVFGTAVPPKGLSGLMRKAAYRYPDHVMRHWTMLIAADRVDMIEHEARKYAGLVIPAALLLLAGSAVRSFLRR